MVNPAEIPFKFAAWSADLIGVDGQDTGEG